MKARLFQRTSPRALAAWLAIAAGAAPAVASAQSMIDTAAPAYQASNVGTSVNPVFRGGVLRTDQDGATYAQDFTLDESETNTLDQAGATTTFSGVFSDENLGTPGSLIVDDSVGGGALTLSGANTYTGATTVRAGTLSLKGTIDTSSGVALTGATAVFDISHLAAATTEIKALSGVAGSQVRLGAKGLTVNQASATIFAGDISGSGGQSFVKTGAGALTLTGVNDYFGQTDISGGTLALSGLGSLANASILVRDGVFDISATTAGATIADLWGTGSGVVVLGDRTLTVTNGLDTFDGVISGAGGLTIAGGTGEILKGANTYTGVTTINAGAALSLSGTGSIASTSGVTVNGTLDISATTSGASTGALSGAGHVILGGETLTLTHGSGYFSGDIGGTGALVLTGGSQTLSGANSYTGGTYISGGTLTLTGGGTLGAPGGSLSMSGGVLDLGGTTQSIGSISLNGGRIIGGALNASAYNVQGGQIDVALGGSATLTQSGSGTTTLSATNTYTGATNISNGTLALAGSGSISASSMVVANGVFDISATTAGAAITRLSGHGGVSLGARTLTLTGAADTFSGVIDGAGGVTVAGGVETLSGANGFTGAAIIDAGAGLRLSGAGGVAAASGVTANGTFDISASASNPAIASLSGTGHVVLGGRFLVLTRASGDFAGDIAGDGGLVVGGGTQTLGGVNTYAGGALVMGGGTLAVRSDAALGGPASGVALDHGVLMAAGDLATARTIQVAAGGGAIRAGSGTIDLSGAVLLGGDLSAGGGRITLSGVIQGGGALTIADGLFYDNGVIAAGSVTVAQGATLRGVGTINAPTTVRGTLAPGNSPGTLTFNAPVTLEAGATSQFDIDGVGTGAGAGAGAYGRMIVNGAGGTFTAGGVLAPRLRGMTGSASNSYVPPIGQAFQIVSAAGGVTPGSSFSGLTQPDGLAAGTRFDAVYARTSLWLVATPAAYGDLAAAGMVQTSNQKAVGAALDADRPAAGVRMSPAHAAIYNPLYGLSAGQIPAALNGLSPEVYADGPMAARQAWQGMGAAVGDELADRRGGPGAALAGPDDVTVWGSAFSRSGDVGPSGAGYGVSVGGMVVGVDRILETGGAIGLALGLAEARADNDDGGRVRGDLIQAMAYGGARRGRAFLDWRVDYLRMDQDLTRPGGPLRSTVGGDNTLQGAGAQVSAGLNMVVRQWRVEPTVSLAALRLTSTATHEASGSALAEDIAGQRNDSVQSFVGVRLARMVRLTPDVSVQLGGLFGWSHEMADTGGEARASLAKIGGAAFTATSAAAGRDAAKLGGGFDAQLTPRITVHGTYAADLARESTAQNLTIGVRLRW